MIVKVLCHFPAGELMFASENIPTENKIYPEENVPGTRNDESGNIIVTSPGVSRTYSKGDTVAIAWQTTTISGNVSLRLKEGASGGIIEASVPHDSSPYTYTIPDTIISDQYYIRVKHDSTGYYGSSADFRVLPAGNWQNRIITISSLSRNIGEDKSYEISGISIEFNDTDRFFRNMMSASDRYIAGNKVELFTEDGQLIYTGTVEKWQFTEDAFVLHINDKLSGLDVMINDLISTEAFPDIAEEADGKSIPIIYGDVQSDTGAVKCLRVDRESEDIQVEGEDVTIYRGTYLVAGHHCKSLDAVFDKDGEPLDMADFDLIEEGTFGQPGERTLFKYKVTGKEFCPDSIRMNVKGKMDSESNLIEDPITTVKNIINNYTDMEYDAGGLAAAQSIMADREYKMAGVIDKQQSLKDILVDFCFSFDCDFYISKGNEIMITMLKWSEMTPEKNYIESQIVGFQLDELPEEIKNKVQYQYKYNFAAEVYKKIPTYTKDSSVANWGEFYNRNEPLNLKFVRDDDSAFDVVQRYVIQRKNPRRTANVDIPLPEFAGLDISDIIEIQHPWAINVNKRKYQVRRINVDFVADLVQVEAVDITTMTGGVFILADKTKILVPHHTWEEADANERNYGYLADRDTGYFENTIDYGKVLY